MAYPQNFERLYVNPSGNIEASGFFKSYLTQELANMYPYWTAIREDRNSVAQQYMSPTARTFYDIEKDMSEGLNNEFIGMAAVDEIDVLTRMKIPSNISYLENPNIECWTAPSGATPSGYPFPTAAGSDPATYNAVQLDEISELGEFYYDVLPTRLKAYDSEPYSDERAESIGVSFPVRPSGIEEPFSKYIDFWKREHDITWTHDNLGSEKFLKQDAETMETYEEYNVGASGNPKGFTFYRGQLYWIGYQATPSGYFLNISNPHPAPAGQYVDTLAVLDITDLIPSGAPPSGIDVDEEGHIWILDEDRQNLYALDTMYDYFLVDKETRYIYFREDYSDPGVFVKPA